MSLWVEGKGYCVLLACSCLLTIFSLFQSAAAGVGFARVDGETYFLHSNSRPDNTLAIVAGPDLETSGQKIDTKLELEAYMYVNSPKSFTAESQNAYIASSRSFSERHQLTFGRRMYDWSVSDDAWKIGTWTPRFNWDPLNPEQVGNTGLFYTYESRSWRVLVFASGMAAPERGVPLNSNLTSPSGDWVSPFSQINLPALNNAQIPIKYNVAYPPLSKLILFPSAALQVKYGEKEGVWASAGYAFMPIHQANLLVEGTLPVQSLEVDVAIHPTVLMQHLITVEAGFKQKYWSSWVSATREIPIMKDHPLTWIQQPMGPAYLFSAGQNWEFLNSLKVSVSGLLVNEVLPDAGTSGNSLSLTLPSRFPYKQAVQAGLNWQANEKWNFGARWILDVANVSDLLSFDTGYRPFHKEDWFFGLGVDRVISGTKKGLVGQFEDNDRVRMRVAYAF